MECSGNSRLRSARSAWPLAGGQLHLRAGAGPTRTLRRRDQQIRCRYRLSARWGHHLDSSRADRQSGAGLAVGDLWRCHRQRDGRRRGRRQRTGRRLREFDRIAAGQHRRDHRSQCRGWYRGNDPYFSAGLSRAKRAVVMRRALAASAGPRSGGLIARADRRSDRAAQIALPARITFPSYRPACLESNRHRCIPHLKTSG